MSFIHIDDLTDWIVDPDPTTLRIGMECEAAFDIAVGPWTQAVLRGHSGDPNNSCPWMVAGFHYGWAAHIRIKKPTEEPTTLVPMTHGDANRLRMMAKDLQVNWGMYAELLIDLADRIEAHLPKPAPQRPEIAIDEPVFDLRTGKPRLFAGWNEDGKPTLWMHGKHSHTTSHRYVPMGIKTKSGQVWPTEGDTN